MLEGKLSAKISLGSKKKGGVAKCGLVKNLGEDPKTLYSTVWDSSIGLVKVYQWLFVIMSLFSLNFTLEILNPLYFCHVGFLKMCFKICWHDSSFLTRDLGMAQLLSLELNEC